MSPRMPRARGTRPRSPIRRAGTSKRAMAAATARRTRTTNPTTWPAAIRRARAGGAAATMATATTPLSTLVLTNARAATPISAGRPATIGNPSAVGARRHGGPERLVAPQGHPVGEARGVPVVVQGVVHGGPVVPEGDGPGPPAEPAGELGLYAVPVEHLEDGVALVLRQGQDRLG